MIQNFDSDGVWRDACLLMTLYVVKGTHVASQNTDSEEMRRRISSAPLDQSADLLYIHLK